MSISGSRREEEEEGRLTFVHCDHCVSGFTTFVCSCAGNAPVTSRSVCAHIKIAAALLTVSWQFERAVDAKQAGVKALKRNPCYEA